MTTPSVLAVIVVKDAGPWLRRSLASLARQTHPRLGVLAIDNASSDGSADALERLLGKRRVIRSSRNLGFPGAARRALSVPAAREADYVLLLHDDVALAPNAVEAMVEAASRFESTGIVGAKVVDWERPEVLREVGFASDRFGHPHSPLEEDEIDHGQYDAPREVLGVSSAAMLVSRNVWSRVGDIDERLKPSHADLDVCWRARVAGFRVLVTPEAVAFHRMAGAREERRDADAREARYVVERAALASMLKCYRGLSLLWLLPAYIAQSLLRAVGAIVGRRLDEVVAILHAWGWNVIRLPGTVRRRARAQAARAAGDHEVTRFMIPPGTRLRRMAQQASALVARRGGATIEEEEAEPEPLRRRAVTMMSAHPAAVALTFAIFLILVGFRDVLFATDINGGALPTFPDRASAFFDELMSPWRTTGFGGAGASSPALAVLGVAGTLTLGDPKLLARLIVALGPLLAAISCYRAAARVTRDPRAAVLAGAAYGLSGLVLWAASEGRVAVLALLAGLPWLGVRFASVFDDEEPRSPLRWIVGTAGGFALVASFFPAVWISVAAFLVPVLASARGGRGRGLVLTAAAALGAAVLVFPFAVVLATSGGGSEVEAAGAADFFSLVRLVPEPTVGSWLAALFLPVGALAGYAVTNRDDRWGGRALASAAVAIPLAWLAAAGHLSRIVANPIAFLAVAAFALSLAIGLGAASALSGMRRTAFGAAQLTTAVLAIVVGAGLLLQSGQVLLGRWEVGEHGEPPAWPVVSRAAARTEFRVLWLAAADGRRLPAPGGQPTEVVPAGSSTVAYSVTGREGRSALAMGLPERGPGYDAVEEALTAMLSGGVRHVGALLAPTGVRFIVASEGGLPEEAERVLGDQVDVDLLQAAGGLSIWRNASALPVASVVSGADALAAARRPAVEGAPAYEPSAARSLVPRGRLGWEGEVADPGVVVVGTEFDTRWQLRVGERTTEAFEAFGWATAFEAPAGPAAVGFDADARRPIELGVLVVLWAGVVWVIGRRPRARARHARVEPVAAPPEIRPVTSPATARRDRVR